MNPNNPSGQPGQPNYPSPMGYPMDYYAAASPFLTQQFGNHIATAFQDQVTQYSGNIVTKSHSWVSKNVSWSTTCDFQVITNFLFSCNIILVLILDMF